MLQPLCWGCPSFRASYIKFGWVGQAFVTVSLGCPHRRKQVGEFFHSGQRGVADHARVTAAVLQAPCLFPSTP